MKISHQPDKIQALREEILATVALYGLVETEEALHIVVLGVRRAGIEDVKE